ncbi:MAG: DNA (cytosine-5-)-methyltransferase [gamma proteobacterium symbiont of Ctena orbiculata]|nr:MAG: DNA (cytosine-5-)-methyltransferase [gamma proteobacterium symbiont of Ctena orbiculata]
MTYKLIDLFAGAGGLTLGFVDKHFGGGFECVFGVDNDQAAVRTHNARFGNHGICANIEELLDSDTIIPKADIVIGGPPCQGFSLLNKKRNGDKRRALWEPFMDVVRRSEASVFVIENVQGLYRSQERLQIESRAHDLGFHTVSSVLNAADFGAPQTRKRTIILGWKEKSVSSPIEFPPPKTHSDQSERDGLPRWRTVRDVISDLDEPIGTEIRKCSYPENLHFGRNPTKMSMERYRAVPEGGNRFDLQRNAPHITPNCWKNKPTGSTDLFGRLWWDRPSVTIRTEFFKPEKGRYLHPVKHRPITHREAARLMGFPDSFPFKGNKLEIARQIGNAVPPALAGALSKCILRALQPTKKRKAA